MVSREYKNGSEEDSAKERSESHCNFVLFHFLPKQRRANLGHSVFLLPFLGQKKNRFEIKRKRIRVIWSTQGTAFVGPTSCKRILGLLTELHIYLHASPNFLIFLKLPLWVFRHWLWLRFKIFWHLACIPFAPYTSHAAPSSHLGLILALPLFLFTFSFLKNQI